MKLPIYDVRKVPPVNSKFWLFLFVDEKGRPLFFYCGEGCSRDIIHKTDIRALQLYDIQLIHEVEPVLQEDQ